MSCLLEEILTCCLVLIRFNEHLIDIVEILTTVLASFDNRKDLLSIALNDVLGEILAGAMHYLIHVGSL